MAVKTWLMNSLYNITDNFAIPFLLSLRLYRYLSSVTIRPYMSRNPLSEKTPEIILSGCMYHVRRKFAEILKVTNATEGVAYDVLKYIAKLARIEEEIKSLSITEKFTARMQNAEPILKKMHDYLMGVYPRVVPKSPLGVAVTYTLNQWPKLLVYLQDGRLENNNNRTERAIKPFAIGRKGWLFSDSVAGAEAGAVIFSLIETCKYHKIEAYDWLRYVLQKIPSCQSDEAIEALLPFNIDRDLVSRLA